MERSEPSVTKAIDTLLDVCLSLCKTKGMSQTEAEDYIRERLTTVGLKHFTYRDLEKLL